MLALKEDHWTKAAMSDDALVVELLLQLKDSRAATSSSSSQLLQSRYTAKSVLPRWGKRMPRSKAAAASRCEAVWMKSRKSKKDDSTTRCSPVTPLSWSGGGSPSGTADGFEESSRPRSKGNATTYESTNTTNGVKRGPRKKKSYDELKEEETSLLNERTSLRQEIATLQTSFEEHRAKNVNLKRAKIDLNLHSSATNLNSYFDGAENAIASQVHQRTVPPSFRHFPSHFFSHATTAYVHPYLQLDSCDEQKAVSSSGNNSFVLPDLNMAPSEEDSASEILLGMS